MHLSLAKLKDLKFKILLFIFLLTFHISYFISHIYSHELKWKFKTGGGVISSPSISSDGTIYFGSLDNYLYALINTIATLEWYEGVH